MMKKISCALLGATLLTSVAMASDMAPMPALSPKCNFSGFYSGLTFGHASGYSNVKVDPAEFDFALKGANGGVFLGYGKELGTSRVYLGLEAAYLASGEKMVTQFSLPATAAATAAFNNDLDDAVVYNAAFAALVAGGNANMGDGNLRNLVIDAAGAAGAPNQAAAVNAYNAANAANAQLEPLPTLSSGDAELSLKKKNSIEVAARMGIAMNNAMPYIKAGIVNSQFQLKGSVTPATHVAPATSDISEKMRLNGLVVGAGVDLKVSRNMMMGLGYTYTTYKPFRKNAGVQDLKPVSHNVMFRLGYAF